MEGIKSSSRRSAAFNIQFWIVAVMIWLVSQPLSAQVVDYNVNVTGTEAPGYYVGQLGRQENEPSCKANPLNELNIMCAYNFYGFADLPDEQGDSWIAFSETRDGYKFIRRVLTGTRNNYPNGQDFAADPTMLASEGFAAVTNISGIRGGNSVMQIQRMMEVNTETGFRHISEAGQIEIARISGSNFIDKPDARIIPHPDGGTESVTMTLEDGSTITRELPRIRILVTFAVFNGSNENIRTFSTFSDQFGAPGSWSNQRQITQSDGLDQGLSVANIDQKVLYVVRRFGDSNEPDSLIGAISRNGGDRIGKVFEITADTGFCPFDQVTLPDPTVTNAVSFRTNDFPWVSATANEFVLVYSERPRDPVTKACLNQGSRVMVRTSSNGTSWSPAVEVSSIPDKPTGGPGHAFQFMQSIDCTDEFCQALWYDTRNESIAFEAALQGVVSNHWEDVPFVEDFNVLDGAKGLLRFRRTADVYTNRINIVNDLPVPNAQSERVSRYAVDTSGNEVEFNLMNVRAFGGNTVPFNGDYIAITKLGSGNFFAAWTDWRNARGQLVDSNFTQPSPYQVSSDSVVVTDAGFAPDSEATPDGLPRPDEPGLPAPAKQIVAKAPATTDRFASAYMPRAEGLSDPNDINTVQRCEFDNDEERFAPFNNLTKNSEIFGAIIEDRVRLVSPTTAKNYCIPDPVTGACTSERIQRTFVIGINNDDQEVDRDFHLVIANQPGNPVQVGLEGDATILENARASWRQLPYGPTFVPNVDAAPRVVETLTVPAQSFDYITLFVVSESEDNPVTVLAYDDSGSLVAELTVNGISEAGDLVDPGVGGDVRFEEVHNPGLIQPDWNSLQLQVETLNPAYRNPAYRNPAYRNPAYRNPAYRNEAFQDPSITDPEATEGPDMYNYDLLEPTELLNSTLRDPETTELAFVDVTFGVEGNTNTITAYNADFAFAGTELEEFDTQVIAWNSNEVDSLRNCGISQISEDTVIAAVNNPAYRNPAYRNPAYRNLAVADIDAPPYDDEDNNLAGSIHFVTGISEVTSLTLRIFGPEADLRDFVLEPAFCVPGGEDTNKNGILDDGEDIYPISEDGTPDGNGLLDPDCSSPLYTGLGYALSAQSANTEFCREASVDPTKCQLNTGTELLIKDVIPPSFDPELVDGTTYTYEADDDVGGTPPDAAATIDLVAELGLTAYDNCDPLTQDCSASEVGVTCEINGTDSAGGIAVALGENPATCFTEADAQENVNEWTGFVFIADNVAPVITIPATELIVAPDNADGAVVNYEGKNVWDDPDAEITVTDNISRDDPPYPYPELSCLPESGSTFGFNDADNPFTTVTCTARDDGPCDGSGSSCVVENTETSYNQTIKTFNVIVRDSDAPDFVCSDDQGQPVPCGDSLDPIEKEATGVNTPVTLTDDGFTATDPDGIDPNPSVAAYTDASCVTHAPTEFPLGTTDITWCATDFAGNTSTIQQSVIIQDTTDPVISVPGDIVRQSTSGTEEISFDVTATDAVGVASITCVGTTDTGGAVTITPTGGLFGGVFPVGTTSVTCTATDTEGNPAVPVPAESSATGLFDVTVEFVYSGSGILGKSSGKNGSSFPLAWAWIGPDGTPDTVSGQELSIARSACTEDTILPGALNPGNSGLRQDTDGSYIYNLQAVDPEDGENWAEPEIPNGGEPFCFRVSLPTGEFQQKQLTIRP